MAKFQLRAAGHQKPYQEFEGDYMTQDGEFVKIMKNLSPDRVEQVAAIRLEKLYSVVKVG